MSVNGHVAIPREPQSDTHIQRLVLASSLCILVSCVTCVHNSLSISNEELFKTADIDSSLDQSIEALGLCHRKKLQRTKMENCKIELLILENNEKYFEPCLMQNVYCWYRKASRL